MWEVVGGACNDVRHLETHKSECWDGEKHQTPPPAAKGEGLVTFEGFSWLRGWIFTSVVTCKIIMKITCAVRIACVCAENPCRETSRALVE